MVAQADGDRLKDLLAKAVAHHRQGELTSAEKHYQHVLDIDPDHADALHLLGVLANQRGDSRQAVERIRRSLEVNPRQPAACNNLGNVHAERDELDEARRRYEQAIALKPDYPQAYGNLGNVLWQLTRFDEATQSYLKAINLAPDDDSNRVALAALHEKLGRWDNAVSEYREAIGHKPDCIPAHRRLGALLRKLGRLDEAVDVYDGWLRFEPDDPVAIHMRAACSRKGVPERASDDYVRACFDGFAADFDEILRDLGYRVPGLVTKAVADFLDEPARGDLDVLDLGCGTGLCAPDLRRYAGRLVGLDLSPGMVAMARQRELYDELVEAELNAYLEGHAAEYDLIVAADTFCYLGDLEPALCAASSALREQGGLVFTVEKLADASATGYRLNRFGRYQHGETYVAEALAEAGLKARARSEETLRTEGGDPVVGMVVVAARADPEGPMTA